eukprot:5643691-Pyramimonas_sp.AAC.1
MNRGVKSAAFMMRCMENSNCMLQHGGLQFDQQEPLHTISRLINNVQPNPFDPEPVLIARKPSVSNFPLGYEDS